MHDSDPILSAEWVNSDGTHAKQIELTKKIDGTYYVIEAAIDTQKKTLMVTSAYMNQKGSAAQSLNMEQSPPQLTSQTPNGSNASVPNISQGKAQVNTEFDNGLDTRGHKGTVLLCSQFAYDPERNSCQAADLTD